MLGHVGVLEGLPQTPICGRRRGLKLISRTGEGLKAKTGGQGATDKRLKKPIQKQPATSKTDQDLIYLPTPIPEARDIAPALLGGQLEVFQQPLTLIILQSIVLQMGGCTVCT